jgi:hypothetical protein
VDPLGKVKSEATARGCSSLGRSVGSVFCLLDLIATRQKEGSIFGNVEAARLGFLNPGGKQPAVTTGMGPVDIINKPSTQLLADLTAGATARDFPGA